MPPPPLTPIATHDPGGVGEWTVAVAVTAGVLLLALVPVALVIAPALRSSRFRAVALALGVAIALAAGWAVATAATDGGERELDPPKAHEVPTRVGMVELIEDPGRYEGAVVTLDGEVTAAVDGDALVLDQWVAVVPAEGRELPAVERGQRVRVTGTVLPFEQVSDRVRGPLDPGGHVGRYDGSHAIVAGGVETLG